MGRVLSRNPKWTGCRFFPNESILSCHCYYKGTIILPGESGFHPLTLRLEPIVQLVINSTTGNYFSVQQLILNCQTHWIFFTDCKVLNKSHTKQNQRRVMLGCLHLNWAFQDFTHESYSETAPKVRTTFLVQWMLISRGSLLSRYMYCVLQDGIMTHYEQTFFNR